MFNNLRNHILQELENINDSGLYKDERIINSPQHSKILVQGNKEIINLCSNNYLGLANHPAIIASAHKSLDLWGYGMSSVRFICGTQSIHKSLENATSAFLGTEDTILYTSCFDANTGLYETLLGPEDAIISDDLNHASIIDGIKLCKAKKYRFRNNDMNDLEKQLKACKAARFRMIATDGVFSMDGTIANLKTICDLADKYQAIVMVDDSHAVGVLGQSGRGTHEYHEVIERIDIITGTYGKALGGASGGYTSGRKEIISLLRQRSRPYLFSNTLSPSIVGASLKSLEILSESTELRDKLESNTSYFRKGISGIGFEIPYGEHPILPIMIGDALSAHNMAKRLLELGVYVIGFSYPVVPKNKARIRVQISAAHTQNDLDCALKAFEQVLK
ncbi:MAG TPA: glycine C-acetyltransferase [Chloroflexi bacterium]|nr:glycine C-acetyltransferase [Chloroflexota bacterium]|tara:strand:+ start:2653 stop:3825 length:1173 start_codon:yes stop_codon:yes gene_type:complete